MASACSPLSKLTDTAVNDGHVLYNVVIDNHHNLVGLEQAHDLHKKAVSIPHNVEPFLGKISGHLTMLLDLQFVAIFPFSILITSLVNVELEIGTGHENESSSEVVDEHEVDLCLNNNQ